MGEATQQEPGAPGTLPCLLQLRPPFPVSGICSCPGWSSALCGWLRTWSQPTDVGPGGNPTQPGPPTLTPTQGHTRPELFVAKSAGVY